MAHPIMFSEDDPMLARVRGLAAAFPEVAEKVSHGRPAFFTTKVFCYFGGSQRIGGEWVGHDQAVLVKAEPSELPALADDDRFWVPAYLGPSGWIGLDVDDDTEWAEVSELLDASYRLTAGARRVRLLDEQRLR